MCRDTMFMQLLEDFVAPIGVEVAQQDTLLWCQPNGHAEAIEDRAQVCVCQIVGGRGAVFDQDWAIGWKSSPRPA